MKKVLIITGLTASGKSGLAVDVAKKFDGEIISMDSVQIYKGMDIGSAKIDKKTMEVVPHHMIDIITPDEDYNVGRFVEDCEKCLQDITSRNKLPILVGGTGLYLKAIIDGYNFGNTERNEDFQNKYKEMAKEKGVESVWNELNKVAPEKASTVHPNNLKRVIRYLEIATFGNENVKTKKILDGYDVLILGIIDDREKIYDKINKRVDIMMEEGLEKEVRGLVNMGITLKNNSLNSIGYREMYDYIIGNTSMEKTIDLIKQHTRNYAKRQLTFMKKIDNLKLVTIDQAKQEINKFLSRE